MVESAKVEILIDAATETAEEALDDVGDRLSGLAPDGSVAAAGVQTAEQAIDSAESASDSLSRSLDTTAENLREAGRAATRTAGQYGVLSGASAALTAATAALSTVFAASLLPAVAALSTAILPLIGLFGAAAAGAVAFGGTLGALVGTGVVTHLQELKAAFKEARQEIVTLIEPLGEVFGPLLVDAVEALPTLVERVLDVIGPVQQFADFLRELGGTAMDVIPALAGFFFDLAETALPLANQGLQFLIGIADDVVAEVGSAVGELSDDLRLLAGATLTALPPLFRFGTEVLEVVLQGLAGIIAVAGEVAAFVNSLGESLAELTAAGVVVTPVITGLATAVVSLTGPFGIVVAALIGLTAAFKTNFMGIRDTVTSAVSEVVPSVDRLRDVFDRVAGRVRATVTPLRHDLVDLLGVARSFADGFRSALGGLSGSAAVNNLRSSVGSLRDVLTDLITVGESILSSVRDPLSALAANVGGALAEAFTLFSTVLREVTDAFSGVTDAVAANADGIGTLAAAGVSSVNALVTAVRGLLDVFRFVFVEFVAPTLTQLVSVFGDRFGEIVGETNETAGTIDSVITSTLSAVRAFWSEWGDEILTISRAVFDVIRVVIVNALDSILTTVDVVLNLIQGDFGEAFDAIVGLVSRTTSRILRLLESWDVIRTVQRIARSITRPITNAVGTVVSGFNRLKRQSITAVRSFVSGVQSSVASFTSSLRSDFDTFTRYIEAVLVGTFLLIRDQIQETFPGLIPTIRRTLSTARQLFDDATAAIDSAIDTTASTSESLFNDLKNAVDTAMSVIDTTVTDAKETVKPVLDDIESRVSTLVDNVTTFVSDLRRSFLLTIQGLLVDALALFDQFGNLVRNTFVGLINGITGLFADGLQGVISTLTDGLNALVGVINTTIRRANKLPKFDLDTLETVDTPQIGGGTDLNRVNETRRERQQEARDKVELLIEVESDDGSDAEATVQEQRRQDRKFLIREGAEGT